MAWSKLGALLVAMAVLGACGGGEEEAQEPPKERRMATERLTPGEETPSSGRLGLSASLSGAAEVPQKGDPDGSGAANFTIDVATGRLCYSVTTDKIATATAAHIHEGEAGKAGPVVIPLELPATGSVDRCIAADPAVVERISTNPERFYANVHNSEYQDGALRGQLQTHR